VNYRQARWAKHLVAYDLKIVYKLGVENPIDASLRRPEFKRVGEIKAIGLLLTQVLLISEEYKKCKQGLDR
jgi:hypothetical protein